MVSRTRSGAATVCLGRLVKLHGRLNGSVIGQDAAGFKITVYAVVDEAHRQTQETDYTKDEEYYADPVVVPFLELDGEHRRSSRRCWQGVLKVC